MSTAEHDDYPQLPPLSLNTRLMFSAIEPEHFELTTEMLEESQAVGRTVRALVTRYTCQHGDRVVDIVTHAALLAVREVIEQAARRQWDVTPSD